MATYIDWLNERQDVYDNIRNRINLLHETTHGDDIVKEVKRVSKKDRALQEFVMLCTSLEKCIMELSRERDSPRRNDEYWSFKGELNNIKREAIIEAYNNGCLEWSFDADQ